MKDSQDKQKADFKKKTREGIDSWKQHIKNKPNDYNNIDKFFNGKDGKGEKKSFGNGERVEKGRYNEKKSKRDGKFGQRDGQRFGKGRFNEKKAFSKDGGDEGFNKNGKGRFQQRGGHQIGFKKGKQNRPGKVSRMINRNKKNSKRN